MDIQVASNFERLIFDLCSFNSNKTLKLMSDLNERGEFILEKEQLKKIHENFCAESLSEDETKSVIKEIYKNQQILIDPHTAVAIGVVKKISPKENTIILATAHPSKFSDTIMNETGKKPELPENLKNIFAKEERYVKLPQDLKKIKDYILEKI